MKPPKVRIIMKGLLQQGDFALVVIENDVFIGKVMSVFVPEEEQAFKKTTWTIEFSMLKNLMHLTSNVIITNMKRSIDDVLTYGFRLEQ
jgi:hypothetical protein